MKRPWTTISGFAVLLAAMSAVASPRLPPIAGDIRNLREPDSLLYGSPVDGLLIGIWSEKPQYRLNHRINVWIGIKTVDGKPASHSLMARDSLFKDSFLFVTRPGGGVTKLPELGPVDGLMGRGWTAGVSDQLHQVVRKPGTYTVEWRIGRLQSGIVRFAVTGDPKVRTH